MTLRRGIFGNMNILGTRRPLDIIQDRIRASMYQTCGCPVHNAYLPNGEVEVWSYNNFIKPQDVTSIADQIKMTTNNRNEQLEKAYKYVINGISPEPEQDWRQDKWQSPLNTLNRKRGDCEDFAFLLASIINALGISSRVALGRIRGYGHAWTEVPTDPGFYILDAAMKVDEVCDYDAYRADLGYSVSCFVYQDRCISIDTNGCAIYSNYPFISLESKRLNLAV